MRAPLATGNSIVATVGNAVEGALALGDRPPPEGRSTTFLRADGGGYLEPPRSIESQEFTLE
eukprot:7123189-Pyramimonas_sp.AAC.1